MSSLGDTRHSPGAGDPQVPLMNLSMVRARMDSLHQFLSDSIDTNTLIAQPEMEMVSSEIASAIHQIIVNGAALLSCAPPVCSNSAADEKQSDPDPIPSPNPNPNPNPGKPKVEDDYEIIEMDAVELLAEHVHFCEICGKGFKRDANLRMHMRAHGNQYKTAAALAKPERGGDAGGRKTRFSCPYAGCNRNKQHKKFRALKSVICVKNHFKRSHCPKMYSCNRCNKKSFSVVADLKSHLKHCGEAKWRCSCGTTFSRKDKLFGHMALFEGHMPAVVLLDEENDEDDSKVLVDGFVDGFESIDFEDVLNSADNNNNNNNNSVNNIADSTSGVMVVMEDFFNF